MIAGQHVDKAWISNGTYGKLLWQFSTSLSTLIYPLTTFLWARHSGKSMCLRCNNKFFDLKK